MIINQINCFSTIMTKYVWLKMCPKYFFFYSFVLSLLNIWPYSYHSYLFNSSTTQEMRHPSCWINLEFMPPPQISRYSHSWYKSFFIRSNYFMSWHKFYLTNSETPSNLFFDLFQPKYLVKIQFKKHKKYDQHNF